MLSRIRVIALASLVLLAAAVASGCGGSDSTASGETGASAGGEAEFTWQKPASKDDSIGYETLKASEVESLANAVASSYDLPQTLTVEGVNGVGAPEYLTGTGSIAFPYGFAAQISEAVAYANAEGSEAELGEQEKELVDLFLEHEIGHLLIASYELPTSGSEENSANEIATSLLLQAKTGAQQAAGAGIFLATFSNRDEPAQLVKYTEAHALEPPQVFEIVCWAAGSSKRSFKEVNEIGAVGVQGCQGEFEQMSQRVGEDLDPHLK